MIYSTIKDLFKGICDAIRSKDGTAEEINHQDIPSRIQAIQSGLDTSDATASATDILSGKTAYVKGEKVTGSIESKAAATYTPGVSKQLIASGQYLSGTQTIQGDSNLISENIKSGVSIFGVSGSYQGSGGIDTSDATATADDMAKGVTAYVKGKKVTGEVTTINQDEFYTPASGVSVLVSGSKLQFKYTLQFTRLFRSGSTIRLRDDLANLGDATAEDVAAGKTFTSSSGLKVTGTHKCSSPNLQSKTVTPSKNQQTVSPDSGYDGLSSVTINGDANLVASNIKSGVAIFGVSGSYTGSGGTSNIQTQHITSASDPITISGSGTVKVWGYGYKSAQYTGTTYSFVGDGYYSGGRGTPSKTSATFSISNGTLSGLPSNITTLDVLVTIGI